MALSRTIFLCAFFATACTAGDRNFPPGFKFGAATSSYQIEGAWNHSDKSESIWDRQTHVFPDTIKNDHNGDVACDSYNKWKEDIQIAAELGLHFYRFSLSWPRLMPTGFTHEISETGKQYYSDLIDGLLEKGIEPVVTLYHWDLPQRLQNLGGWTNPMIVDWFADYAKAVYSLYADRVKTWITINEPIIMCEAAYNTGLLAPTFKDLDASYLCIKHVMLAHAKAWRAYDKEFRAKHKGRVGITNQLIWFETDSEDAETVQLIQDFAFGLHSHPIYSKQGGWPPALEQFLAKKSKQQGYSQSKLPAFTKDETDLVKGTFDFYGLNYYTSALIRKGKIGEKIGSWPLTGHPEMGLVITRRPNWERADSYWLNVTPEGLRKVLAWLKENYGDIEYMIFENGYSSTDRTLEDLKRVQYIEDHLEQILLAIKEDGINITAYTVWSLMDNFEWNDGYSMKFGLYDVDFEDAARRRTPRASARYYSNVIKNHALGTNIVEHKKYIDDEL